MLVRQAGFIAWMLPTFLSILLCGTAGVRSSNWHRRLGLRRFYPPAHMGAIPITPLPLREANPGSQCERGESTQLDS